MNLTHQFVQDQIQSGRKLTGEEQAALSAHLAACPECRAYAAFHQQLSELLPVSYPSHRHVEKEIRAKAKIVQAKVEKRRRVHQFFQHTFSLAGVGAALLLFLVVLGILPGILPGQPAADSDPAPVVYEPTTAQPRQTSTAASQPAATPELLKPTGTVECLSLASENVERIPAPNGEWTALFQKGVGELAIEDEQGNRTCVEAGGQYQYLVPASWSPDSRYLLFWQGMNSASAQADGLPLWSIEVRTRETFQLSRSVLVNAAYLSWAPDGSALVFTNGGYRSAQVSKWLSLYSPAGQQVIDIVPQESLIPGAAAWSPDGKTIAFAAVDAALTGPEYADYMGWDNPAILGRRIYLLDPNTGTYRRLNQAEAYQDAPRWGEDGRLFFVQLDQDQAQVIAHDPVTAQEQPLPDCQSARPPAAGTYGQVDWQDLFDACQAIDPNGTNAPAPVEPSPGTPDSVQVKVVPAVAVDGQTAYIGAGSRLAAVDLRQPAAPQLLAQSEELPGQVLKVLKISAQPSPRIAASAGRYLAVLDPSTPGKLGLLTQSKLPGPITALILDIGSNRIYAGGVLNSDATRGFIAALDASQPDTLHLLDTIELRAPVQSLALSNAVLYTALTGDAPGVIALPVRNDQMEAPVETIPNLPAASMTAVRGVLYLGSSERMLAYRLDDPYKPQLAWQIEHAGDAPLPGTILGFELRAGLIYTAGLDSSGKPFRVTLPLSGAIQTGSMVDTASHIAVTSGMMLVAGDRLEIYDVLDSQNLKLLGTYPAVQPD